MTGISGSVKHNGKLKVKLNNKIIVNANVKRDDFIEVECDGW